MRIAESSIAFQTAHRAEQRREEQVQARFWIDDDARTARRRPPERVEGSRAGRQKPVDRVEVSKAGKKKCRECVHQKRIDEANEELERLDPEVRFIKRLLEAWLGREIDFAKPITKDVEAHEPEPNPSVSEEQPRDEVERAGWGLEIDHRETYHESEDTTFSAQGSITTADGHEVDFALTLAMSRSFTEERTFNLRLGDAALVDPLVLNFDGTHAQLSDRVFMFDLNNDGEVENLQFVDAGSGYLALDKNGDGTINDGTELFGTVTGDGFGELAAYDQDGNGWIDEGDAVFDQLKVWKQDGLHSLASTNVGAIYLNAADTPFALMNGPEQRGQIQQTGLFVNEDYSIGTVQKVDYVV